MTTRPSRSGERHARAISAAVLLTIVQLGLGCGGKADSARSPEGTSVTSRLAKDPLGVRAVPWNAAKARVGKVKAVADSGDVVAVFADDGAHVFTAGALVATDTSVRDWVDADTILGPDGSARWIIGVDGRGRLYHLRGRSSFEEVSERFGLGAHRVRDAAVLGTGYVGFLLDDELALADGERVTRYAVPRLFELNGGGGFGAGVARDSVFVFTARHRAIRTYALPNATHAVLGPDGRLFATTPRAVYATNAAHDLVLMHESDHGDAIHGLVASAEHVWFADRDELGVIDGEHIALTNGAKIPVDARLAPSSSGDVWVLADGALSRFARVEAEPDVARAWNDKLSSVFARACASCHQANGASGVDLSNAEAWHARRMLIHDRVVVSRTMPPQGHVLSDADRESVRQWTEAAEGSPSPSTTPGSKKP